MTGSGKFILGLLTIFGAAFIVLSAGIPDLLISSVIHFNSKQIIHVIDLEPAKSWTINLELADKNSDFDNFKIHLLDPVSLKDLSTKQATGIFLNSIGIKSIEEIDSDSPAFGKLKIIQTKQNFSNIESLKFRKIVKNLKSGEQVLALSQSGLLGLFPAKEEKIIFPIKDCERIDNWTYGAKFFNNPELLIDEKEYGLPVEISTKQTGKRLTIDIQPKQTNLQSVLLARSIGTYYDQVTSKTVQPVSRFDSSFPKNALVAYKINLENSKK